MMTDHSPKTEAAALTPVELTPLSQPGTKVLALIPNLFGPGLHAEMTYYETDAGARVFSAGVLDFPAVLITVPIETFPNVILRS